MANPVNQVTFGIPSSSSDGKFYSRYPRGDKSFIGAASGSIGTVAAVTPGGNASQTTFGPAHDLTTLPVEGSGTEWVSFGHVFPQGEVVSADNVVITDNVNNVVSTMQTDKRASYPDGSLKHAIIHAQLVGGQTYKIRTGTPPTGTALTTAALLAAILGDIARVTLSSGISGSAILRDLISSATNRAAGGLQILEQGPKMLGLTVSQNFATHLRVTFHLRWYGGTTLWCSYLFETCYADVSGSGTRNYRAVLNLNGSDVFDTGVAALSHWNRSTWRRAVWSTGGNLYARHNAQYFIDSGAAPQYETRQTPTGAFLNTLPQGTVPPMGRETFWGIDNDLDGVGYHPHLGILPVWDALYFTSLGDRRTYNAMLNGHDSMRICGFCWMDSLTGEHIRTSDRPTFTITGDVYAAGAIQSQSPATIATGYSHGGSMGFVPYLLTGDYAYLRQLTGVGGSDAFWANTNTNITHAGMSVRGWYTGSIRGMAWAYRTVAQTAWALPDSHSSKAYFINVVNGNGVRDEGLYVNPGTSPDKNELGMLQSLEWSDGIFYSGFFHYFYTASTAYVGLDLGFSSVLPIARYAGKFVSGVLGSTGEYPFEMGARFSYIPGPSAGVFYSTFTQLAANTANVPTNVVTKDSGTLAMATAVQASGQGLNHTGIRNEMIGDMASPSYYFGNLQPAGSYLERLGLDGGFVCWYRTQLSGRIPDWRQIPQFGIVPRARRKPAYIRAASLLAWTQITGSRPDSVTPSPVVAGDPRARIYAWGTLCAQIKDSKLWDVGGGGHGDYAGNGAYSITLNSETPVWSQVLGPTPTASITPSVAFFADGRPNSAHGYWDLQMHNGLGRTIRHGLTFVYPDPNSFDVVAAFNTKTGAYLPSNTYPTSLRAAGVAAKNVSYASEFIYYLSTGSNELLRRFNPGNGTTVGIGTSTGLGGEIYRAAAVDPIRGRVLISRSSNAADPWVWFNIDTGARNVLSPPGAAADLNRAQGSLEWDPIGNRYLFYSTGQEIYAIDPVTFAATALGISGSPPPSAFPPGTNKTGLHARARFLPELGVLAVVSNADNNIYFARLYS